MIRASGMRTWKNKSMSIDLKNAFRLSFVTGETEPPIPAVSEILARLRSGRIWDVASIAPADDQFPLLHVEWHEGRGFVIQCYEDEHAWSDFLLAGPRCGPPTIEINLGGQALDDDHRSCLFLKTLLVSPWTASSRRANEIWRCIWSESTPSLERLSGRAGKEERPGSSRIRERSTTSNFHWSRRRVDNVRRGSSGSF